MEFFHVWQQTTVFRLLAFALCCSNDHHPLPALEVGSDGDPIWSMDRYTYIRSYTNSSAGAEVIRTEGFLYFSYIISNPTDLQHCCLHPLLLLVPLITNNRKHRLPWVGWWCGVTVVIGRKWWKWIRFRCCLSRAQGAKHSHMRGY